MALEEKETKTAPSPVAGGMKTVIAKAMAFKLPGGVPLPVFLGTFFGVFLIGTAVMAYMGLHRIALLRKQYAAPVPVSGVQVKSTGTVAGVVLSTAAPTAVAGTAQTASPAVAASGGEIDNNVINFLLHSYEEQKARISSQEEKIAKLENTLAEVGKKSPAPAPAAPKPSASAPAAKPAAPKARTTAAPKKPSSPAPSPDIKRLADLYTQMKPADVSSIIEDLDDDTLVRVFALMKPRTVAKILSLMDPQRAALISRKIAN